MKKHLIVSALIIAIPLLLMLVVSKGSESVSNLCSLLEFLYLSPALIAKDHLFGFQKDLGLLPTNLGRVLVTSLYLLVYWGIVLFLNKGVAGDVQDS